MGELEPLIAADGGGYATFAQSQEPQERPEQQATGLEMREARARLLAAIERPIELKERSLNASTEFRDPFALLLVLCAGFRLADLARHLIISQVHDGRAVEAAAEGVFLLAAAAANVALNWTQRSRLHAEMAERVRVAVQQMLAHDAAAGDKKPEKTEAGGDQAMLLPSNSYVACYRDRQWMRLPMNLLVEGDVVGLMSGDIAPGEVLLVDDQAEAKAGTELKYARGSKLPSWSTPPLRVAGDSLRSTVTFNAPLLLKLCGEMRVFRMLETPVVRDIENALFSIERPETYTQRLLWQAQRISAYICAAYSVLLVVAIGLRAVFQRPPTDATINHVLLGPTGIWLCFASLHTPFVLFIAEAAATATILSAFQDVIMPEASSNLRRHHHHHHHRHNNHERSPTSPRSRNGRNSDMEGKENDEPVDASEDSPASPKSHHIPDAFDVEEREKIRSEKAQTMRAALTISLRYFLVALKFRTSRFDEAHVCSRDGRRCLPIPFRSFRLLERLGSTTMLCCFDDDILCDQSPSAEEIFLLTDKQGSSQTVLDLHLDRDCETGLKFEDPRWKHYLPSLKPIGLAIMLNDAEEPARLYQENVKYLSDESALGNSMLQRIPGGSDPDIRSCLQRLSVHVRMLPFPKYLLNLSREMGFDEHVDLESFQRRQSIHIISPRLAHHEHTNDHHDQGQEDSRYRGNLKSHMYSTVVLDKRSHRHQLVSRGHPTVVLAHCTEYWDGKSICPLTSDKQKAILEMYNQWRVEDLDCVALSYVPVPHKLNTLFSGHVPSATASVASSDAFASSRSLLGNDYSRMLPPVFLVSDNAMGDEEDPTIATEQRAAGVQGRNFENSSVFSEDRASMNDRQDNNIGRPSDLQVAGMSPPMSPPMSPRSPAASATSEVSPRYNGLQTGNGGSAVPSPSPSPSHYLYKRRRSAVGRASSIASSSAAGGQQLAPGHSDDGGAGSIDKNSLLWQVQDDQIFLGMVATGIQPKKSIPDLIEDLDACGIRFVYFSPRNMRRSKLLAEKMGIETDWNCAISLRSLATDGPDPHRMTSTYSDWDVKARLPHGVAAIKRHLEEVDNVPLLVSLYTDSTPETIRDMIGVFQEHHEVVMGVGSSLKETNAPLFAASDVAVGIQGKPHAFFHQKVPSGDEVDWKQLCEEDLQFSHILNTLACSFRLKSVEDDAANKGATPSLPHLLELIRLGRRLLTNFYQLYAFIFVSQLQIATLIVFAYLAPLPLVAQLSCVSIFWLLWGLVPVISLTMLASTSEKDVMKKTPRKNEPIDTQDEMPRLVAYFIIRHVPSALLAIVVFHCLVGYSLQAAVASTDFLGPLDVTSYRDYRWIDFVLRNNEIVVLRPRPPAVTAAVDRAEAGMLLLIALSIIASSSGYLYRCESLLTSMPTRCNRMWIVAASALLVIQIIISIFRAGITGADGSSLWHFMSSSVPWFVWVLFFVVWPLVVIATDEAVKSHDRAYITRYYRFMRMQFDTRLGMWSPK